MDHDVAQTLAALERKLADLERELHAAGKDQALAQPGVLVDEAIEQRFSMDAQETVFGEIPATKDDRQSIELADLVRFKEKMQATLQGLIDEYSQLLSLRPPTDS